jgi:hypothetical protein
MQNSTNMSLQSGEFDLVEYGRVLRRRQKTILAATLGALALALLICFRLPRTYLAQASILPLDKSPIGLTSENLASRLTDTSLLLDLLPRSGASGATKMLLSILSSRTVAENVIRSEDLLPLLKAPTMEEGAENLLADHVNFSFNRKQNTILIQAEFTDPTVASRVVNRYISEVGKFVESNDLLLAKRNREFIGNELQRNRVSLLELEKHLSEFHEDNRLSGFNTSLNVTMKDLVFPDPASDVEPPLELSSLVIPAVPQQVLFRYRSLQNLVLTDVNRMLAYQYQLAKIDESKEGIAFRVIDPGETPIQRHGPNYALILINAILTSLVLSGAFCFLSEYVQRMKRASA